MAKADKIIKSVADSKANELPSTGVSQNKVGILGIILVLIDTEKRKKEN